MKPLSGLFSDKMIEELHERGAITSKAPISSTQFQPASLDLRLGSRCWRVRAGFLPGGKSVKARIEDLELYEIDLGKGAVLETGCVYVAELQERLALPGDTEGLANPKSSIGRIDVFTRLLTDYGTAFNLASSGYEGPLYVEISPGVFPVLVREGSRLLQMRFRSCPAYAVGTELDAICAGRRESVDGENFGPLPGSIAVHVACAGLPGSCVGYRGRRYSGLIDVDQADAYAIATYWEAIMSDGSGSLILDPNEFYILASKEQVRIPIAYSAEMIPFDPLVGEFRVHYAGFFDPGFGVESEGGHAVLEVRSHDVPFMIEDGQVVGSLVYEHMAERPLRAYGKDLGSHYQGQGLRLSKHFRKSETG